MPMFVDYLRSLPLYQQLTAIDHPHHGDLLFQNERPIAEAQIEALRLTIRDLHPVTVLEVGVARGMFGFVLSEIYSPHTIANRIKLVAIEIEPTVKQVAETLNHGQDVVEMIPIHGSSKDHLAKAMKKYRPQLVWLDGDHSEEATRRDLEVVLNVDYPLSVMVDDTRMAPHISQATYEIAQKYGYMVAQHPYWESDKRGMLALARAEPIQEQPTERPPDVNQEKVEA